MQSGVRRIPLEVSSLVRSRFEDHKKTHRALRPVTPSLYWGVGREADAWPSLWHLDPTDPRSSVRCAIMPATAVPFASHVSFLVHPHRAAPAKANDSLPQDCGYNMREFDMAEAKMTFTEFWEQKKR